MNQFFLQQPHSDKLPLFPHIIEFAIKKNQTILLNSFKIDQSNAVRFYFIIEGKFEWQIDNQSYILYPGDTAIVLPGQLFGSEKGFLDIGILSWLHIESEALDSAGKIKLGKWCSLSDTDRRALTKILLLNRNPVLSKLKDTGIILQKLETEIFKQEIGYSTRTNQLIDELFILIARKLTQQNNSQRDFPQTFMKLEQTLRQNLSHHWTIEEMAALVGLGTTAFTEKVKNYTGFSPLNYLITIRISEAIRLLKGQNLPITDIALDTGFYSSQHFSTTFKKLTGYTPSEFKKNNIPQN
ncbi:MAG: AraC family transcriptional regulator [Ferruginibacter sp.]